MNDQLEALQSKRAAIIEADEELEKTLVDEGRKRTREEEARANGYMDEAEGLAKEIDALMRLQAVKSNASKSERIVEPEKEIRTEARVEVPPVYNKAQLKAFQGANAVENAHRASKWVQGYIYDMPEAREYCRVHGIGEKRVQTEAVLAGGGALVPEELDTAIINIRDAYGMARQECRVIQMGTDTMQIPRRTEGLTAYFTSETTATQASDTAWDVITLTAQKLSCLTRVSKSLSEDSIISITDMLADEIGQAFAAKEDRCLVNATGIATDGGMTGLTQLMNVASGNAGAYFQATAGEDQWGEMLEADVIELLGMLPDHSHPQAKWYMSRIAWGAMILRLVNAHGGNGMIDLAVGMRAMQYMGYPVALYSEMPHATTAYNDTVMILFGDISRSSTMGTRRGITLEVDRSRYLEFDQLGVFGTERFQIVNHDIGTATAPGCVVALVGQT